ncbi:ankyrin repeat domain-containing protein [Streptomyces avicenniae]|uniref:ankyrin repeat domain-containing protein n=1 Tax=Streptomyces avicenniae TaxID=500153 RepID=UPI00069952B3|nr:ankyrin repeat domain-containing protein [Streptomyces avicenniae]
MTTAVQTDDTDLLRALLSAAHTRDLPALRAALAAGADVDGADERGWTAVLVATLQAFREGVEVLLASGADPGSTLVEGRFGALHHVIQYTKDRPLDYKVTVVRDGREVVLTGRDEIRAEIGSHPDDTYDDCVAIAAMLIDAGIDVDQATSHGQTPLSHAASRGTAEITRLLLATGRVALDSHDQDGLTPLHYASRHGFVEPVELLLAAGADPGSRENFGFTPLHEAAENGHAEVARALLAAGADPRAGLTKAFGDVPAGTTAHGLATVQGHAAVAALLERTV